MLPRSVSRIAVVVVALFALVAMALVPAAPVEAVDVGFDVRFTGVVQTVGSDTEPWVIGGQTVMTDEDTTMIKLVEPTVGVWADVAAKKNADGTLDAVQITVRQELARLRGVLMSKPAETEGEWVVAGVTIMATADTKISSRSSEIAVGKWVEVVMTEDKGVLTARTIAGIGEQDAVIVNGEIQEVTDAYWVISSIKVYIQPDGEGKTVISGEPVVGLIGRAAAELQEDDSLLAIALRVAWIDRTELKPYIELDGTVTAMDVSRMPKTITVETDDDPAMSYTIHLMPNSRIHQEKGLLTVGAEVHVVGWQYDGGKVIASEITVVNSPEEGGEFVTFRGEIMALPDGGLLGEWKIGDMTVIVNEQTQRVGWGKEPKVGGWAVGGGVKRADGTIVATRVVVFAPPQPGHPAGSVADPEALIAALGRPGNAQRTC